MPGRVGTDRTITASRVARLACMPEDADAAIARFKHQVRSAWILLDRRDHARLVVQALRTTTPLLPGLSPAIPSSLAALLARLDDALAQHHPEELRVASFAWLSALIEHVGHRDGTARAAEILDGLECTGR